VFLLKKILSRLVSPVPLCLDVLLTGVLLLWFRRKPAAGKVLVSTATVVLLLLGSPNVSRWLVRPLEFRYAPPVRASSQNGYGPAPRVHYIVVLSGGFTPNANLPALDRLGRDTLIRVAEGTRLHREFPESTLIMSGGGPAGGPPAAAVMAEAAESLGVGREKILLEPRSRDTESEAQCIRPLVGSDPFILVTEASHMPRAMALFRKQGMNPIPAPTGYLVKGPEEKLPTALIPSGEGFPAAQRAMYEYLALTWEWVRGKI
jgi:uncharacterized SAM-binding protein YcdF (DUF218 family)